jgi:hypothetical protein
VTFTNWRVIYWVQVGMVGFGLALSLLFVPDIEKVNENEQDEDNIVEIDNKRLLSTPEILSKFDPRGIFRPFMCPNILFAVGLLHFKTIMMHLILYRSAIGFDLWFSGLLSICASYLSPHHNQSTFSPHDTSC